jgi:hypothetical protein
MRLRYSLILALLLHIVTKCVQTLIIAIYQFVKSSIEKKNTSWARNHFFTSVSLNIFSADLWGAFSSLGTDRSPTVPNQDCMVEVEEFPSPSSSNDSRLRQHCEVEHCRAKEELRVLWSTIVVSPEVVNMCTNWTQLVKFLMFTTLLSLHELSPFLGFFLTWTVIEFMILNNIRPIVTIMVITSIVTLYYHIQVCYLRFIILHAKVKWNIKILFEQ